ncbi:putative integral membrane protein [Golovinomyces cichoracearum]|uniref:Putative integral membrane protein n=1 Tax=Golovinomyces cichoracearum TaxID=62708 RepID=A0A420I6T9_9PEZI|nr:putative integral membrane protein [Golovinomyces cichoracearum]
MHRIKSFRCLRLPKIKVIQIRKEKCGMKFDTRQNFASEIIFKIIPFFSFFITSILAQASPDGNIVPFSSTLPVCASKCGPLFDVQGKCVPPVTAAVDDSCFCLDSRLEPFRTGTAGVSTVCGPASCSAEADLQSLRQWYSTFCKAAISNNSDGRDTPTLAGSDSKNQSWIAGHRKWVAMLVIIFIFIAGAWISAYLFHKQYHRHRETQPEIADPIAWGPHQLQGATGGYSQNTSTSEKSTALNNAITGPGTTTSAIPPTIKTSET